MTSVLLARTLLLRSALPRLIILLIAVGLVSNFDAVVQVTHTASQLTNASSSLNDEEGGKRKRQKLITVVAL